MINRADAADEQRILDYCRHESEINIFIIGDILNFGFDKPFQDVYVAYEGDSINAIILRYYRNYIVYTRDETSDLSEITEFINQHKPEVLSAKREIIDRLMPNMVGRYGRRDMLFSRLTDFGKILQTTHGIEKATVEDARRIAEAMGQIDEFRVLYSDIPEEHAKQIENRIRTAEGVHLYINRGDEIIAHANSTAETTDTGIIGGVFTVPSVRRQGYAKKVVSALCSDMLERGRTPCLFYDNEEAGALYLSLGFKVSDYWTVLGGIEDE